MKLTDNEIRDINQYLEKGKPLPEKYRFLLFEDKQELTSRQINLIYASEADILNMALFGMTAGQWRNTNPNKKGNIRDYANVSQLICLSNLENLNALFIHEKISQSKRLAKLNQVAIQQMRLLTDDIGVKKLEGGN